MWWAPLVAMIAGQLGNAQKEQSARQGRVGDLYADWARMLDPTINMAEYEGQKFNNRMDAERAAANSKMVADLLGSGMFDSAAEDGKLPDIGGSPALQRSARGVDRRITSDWGREDDWLRGI